MQDTTITVIVFAVFIISTKAQETGLDNLETIAGSMRRMGLMNFLHQSHSTAICVVLGPEHAYEIAKNGFSRQDVPEYLFEHARMPVRE